MYRARGRGLVLASPSLVAGSCSSAGTLSSRSVTREAAVATQSRLLGSSIASVVGARIINKEVITMCVDM